jgi:hypothetical protein
MSRVLVIARPDARRSQLCEILAHAGYECVAVDDAAAFRASRDWSLHDILVLESQPANPAAEETLRTYVSRFRPGVVVLPPRWSPEVVHLAVEHRHAERTSQRGTRRKEAQYYGAPREIASLELVLLAAALSPVPRPSLMTVAQGAGYDRWSGRMVKHVLRRLERKGELVPDEETGNFQTTAAGRRRLEHARAAASVRSA